MVNEAVVVKIVVALNSLVLDTDVVLNSIVVDAVVLDPLVAPDRHGGQCGSPRSPCAGYRRGARTRHGEKKVEPRKPIVLDAGVVHAPVVDRGGCRGILVLSHTCGRR